MRILVQGWFGIYHSYALVCYNELRALSLVKDVEIYIDPQPFFNPEWKQIADVPFNVWNNEVVDIVYRIVFPYNTHELNVPKCVFYTAEFGALNPIHLSKTEFPKGVYFKTPSQWNVQALPKNTPYKVITHGVDTTIFYPEKNPSKIKEYREEYGLSENDIVLLNISAMTGNKGIDIILASLPLLNVNKRVKLILKGIGSLYKSRDFVNQMMTRIPGIRINDILYIDDELNTDEMRQLYQLADVYVSPYRAEGFNLPVLEAIACGTKVVVSDQGGTADFIHDLQQTMKGIHTVKTTLISGFEGFGKMNEINIHDFVTVLETAIKDKEFPNGELSKYSWDTVAKEMYDYFQAIIKNDVL